MSDPLARTTAAGRRSRLARPAFLVLLSVWLGAAVFFALVVTRAAFQVLPTRALAGTLVGRTLPILLLAGVVGGIVALWMELQSEALEGRRVRSLCVVGLAILCEAGTLVGQHVDRLLASVGGDFDALPRGDPLRVAFGRWHGVAVAMFGIAMFLAAVAIVSAARRQAHGG